MEQVVKSQDTRERWFSRQQRNAMIAVMMAVALSTLDISIVYSALPKIGNELAIGVSQSVWIITAYHLAIVATLLSLAALGDLIGHRRVFLAGLLLFTGASLVCGSTASYPVLIGARIIQGVGGSGIISVTIALIRLIYPPQRLGRGLALYALVVSLFFALGPAVASLILSVVSWHYLFLINFPIGLTVSFLAFSSLPQTARSTHHRFDLLAALLCGALFGLFIHGLSEAATAGSWHRVTVEWGLSLLCGLLLVQRQKGQAMPLLATDLFDYPTFTLGALTAICTFTAQGLAFVALPFLFVNRLHLPQLVIGQLMTIWPAAVAAMTILTGRLAERYRAGALGGVGLVIMGTGVALLAGLPIHTDFWAISWRLALGGIGFALFQAPNMNDLQTSVPRHRSGGASGVAATARILGQTSGATLAAGCLTLWPGQGDELALWLAGSVCGVASAISLSRLTIN